jgi:hypothetical protein
MTVLLLRTGREADHPSAEPPKNSVHQRRSEQGQQRRRPFPEVRAPSTSGESAGRIEAQSQVPIVAERQQAIPRAATAVPVPKAAVRPPADVPQSANVPQGVQDKPIPFDEDPDDIPALTRISLQDPDPDRRLAAVTLLGASDDPQVIPVLAQALSDKDEEVRLAAVQSLSDFTGEAAVDAIEPALNDTSADIRYEALEVLADLDAERARPFVKNALNDPDEDVRSLAESLLEDVGDTPAGEPSTQGAPGAQPLPR